MLAGYGIKQGYTKGGQIINRVKVSKELAGKVNISVPAAHKLLLAAERHAKQNIAQQQAVIRSTSPPKQGWTTKPASPPPGATMKTTKGSQRELLPF